MRPLTKLSSTCVSYCKAGSTRTILVEQVLLHLMEELVLLYGTVLAETVRRPGSTRSAHTELAFVELTIK